jgi:hypothetical protein
MSWISSGAPKQVAKKSPAAGAPLKPASKAPVSLEFSTTVSARGIAPANAVIEHLTTAECRFRTVVLFDHGAIIELPVAAQGATGLARGTVVARASNGPRFAYGIRLDRMTADETDALARVITPLYRKQMLARAHDHASRDLPTTERLTRSSVRVMTQFDLVYRTPKQDFRTAKAADVSSGGLLMTCTEALVEGEPVELRFTLPSDVVNAYPEETMVIDLRNRTAKSNRPDQRRGFEEMVVGARVVSHRPLGNNAYAYGLAFTCINGYQREEIARYTHAVQRSRNRH